MDLDILKVNSRHNWLVHESFENFRKLKRKKSVSTNNYLKWKINNIHDEYVYVLIIMKWECKLLQRFQFPFNFSRSGLFFYLVYQAKLQFLSKKKPRKMMQQYDPNEEGALNDFKRCKTNAGALYTIETLSRLLLHSILMKRDTIRRIFALQFPYRIPSYPG